MTFYFFKRFIFSERAGSLIRRISWLSLIAISVSVSAFLIVLFVMNGMNESIQKRIMSLEPHLVIQKKESTRSFDLENEPIFKKIKDLETPQFAEFENQDVILRTIDGQFRGGIARGITRDRFESLIDQLGNLDVENKNRVEDIISWSKDEIPGPGEVVVGIDLARSLNLFEGDYLTVVPPEGLLLPPGEAPPFEKVQVRKIISTNLADLDAQYIFYQRGLSLKKFSNTASRQSGVEVWLSSGKNAEWLKSKILDDKYSIETWVERNSALFYALRLEKMMIGIFLGLAGLIASTSILTVLALLMSQKRRDIALLRTLGLSGQRTMKLFVMLGVMLSFSGVGVGLLIGTGLGYYIQENPINILPQIYYDSQIPARVDWLLILGVLLVSSVVSFLGSWWPAKEALSIEPAQSLRIKN